MLIATSHRNYSSVLLKGMKEFTAKMVRGADLRTSGGCCGQPEGDRVKVWTQWGQLCPRSRLGCTSW